MPPIDPSPQEAASFFEDISKIFATHRDKVIELAEQELTKYRGLPAAINPFEVIGKSHSETVLSSALAWLLDPMKPHGLKDALLRRFLLRAGGPECERQVLALDQITAFVEVEVSLADGRPDIVILLRGLLISVEVKVDATESEISVEGVGFPQAGAYRIWWRKPGIRKEAINAAFGKEGSELLGEEPQVCSIFLRKRGRKGSDDSETASIDWLEIEQDLGELVLRHELVPEARAFIQSFRTTLLAGAGSCSSQLQRIHELRQLTDLARHGKVDAVSMAIRLGAVVDTPNGESTGKEKWAN